MMKIEKSRHKCVCLILSDFFIGCFFMVKNRRLAKYIYDAEWEVLKTCCFINAKSLAAYLLK